jgi:hypothetical protein
MHGDIGRLDISRSGAVALKEYAVRAEEACADRRLGPWSLMPQPRPALSLNASEQSRRACYTRAVDYNTPDMPG